MHVQVGVRSIIFIKMFHFYLVIYSYVYFGLFLAHEYVYIYISKYRKRCIL